MSDAHDTVPEWDLGDRLAKALKVGGVSVQEMADELGVHRNTVTNYIHGARPPKRSVLRVWALRCGVPFDWLAGPKSEPAGGGGIPETPPLTRGSPASGWFSVLPASAANLAGAAA